MNDFPNWLKSSLSIFALMVCWDIVRLFLQAFVNKWVMKSNFEKIEEAVEDLEGDIEENENNEKKF